MVAPGEGSAPRHAERVKRVLFLCSHNAARSQMAEGFLRSYAGDRFHVQSAGTKATAIHPLAVRAMREVGIDITAQRSKSVDDVGEGWDVVVTVCDANCPIPPRSGLKLRWTFPDPALAGGDEEARLTAFRAVRDGIKRRVRLLAGRLG
jgi:arsenate reductase